MDSSRSSQSQKEWGPNAHLCLLASNHKNSSRMNALVAAENMHVVPGTWSPWNCCFELFELFPPESFRMILVFSCEDHKLRILLVPSRWPTSFE